MVSYAKHLPGWLKGGIKQGRGESEAFWCEPPFLHFLVYSSTSPATSLSFYLHMPVPVCGSIFIHLSFSIFPLIYSFSLSLLHASPAFFFHLASALVCQLSHVELCLSYLLPMYSLHSDLLQYGPQSPPVQAYNYIRFCMVVAIM